MDRDSSRKCGGFTILEVLLVLAIIVVVAIVALPNFFNAGNTTDLNSAAQEMTASLRQAQNQSADQQNEAVFGVYFSNPATGTPFYATFTGLTYSTSSRQNYYPLPADLAYVSSTLASCAPVTFSAVSGASSVSTTIGIYSKKEPALKSAITISGSGLVSYASPSTNAISFSTYSSQPGNLWIADGYNDRIQEFSASGKYLSQFGSEGTGNGQFQYPAGIAIATSGNLWVSDMLNYRIQEFSASGTYLSKFGSQGTGNGQFESGDGGNEGLYGVTIDANGNLWVPDQNNYRIEEFSATGTYLSQFGSEGTGNGQFGDSSSGGPLNIAIDASGNLWVTDSGNFRIQEFQRYRNLPQPIRIRRYRQWPVRISRRHSHRRQRQFLDYR